VASGLEYLHKQNPPVIHQDIKPDNVLIDANGQFMITDFGISAKARSTLRKSAQRHNVSGGTIAYMAPERFGKDNTPVMASDIWALGATLYELLTGDTPFGEHGGLVQKSGAEIPTLDGNWSNELKQIVKSCLQPNPDDRPSAQQIVNRHRRTPSHHKDKNNKAKVIISLVTALLILVGTAFFVINRHYKHKHYAEYVVKAEDFYAGARYDSALTYFYKALNYVESDSIRYKMKMLDILISALRDFYNARYADAFEGFQQAADMGSGDASYYLGELTYNGLATPKDYNKGWKYTKQAFNKGFKMAYWRMANAYERGHGVPQNKDSADYYYFEAIEGIKKMADNGDPEALANLAVMYENGQGVSQNSKKAAEYDLKAAESGYAFVMVNLANRYRFGYSLDKDEDEAMKWYLKSAKMGNPGALFELGEIYLYGYCGQNKDADKGIEMMEKAAKHNYAPALTRLGYLYWEGKRVEKDLKKSFRYSLQAIEYDKDNVVAMINVAHDYSNGNGVNQDYLKSKEYYEKALAADTSRTDCYIYIGRLYKTGGPNLAKDTDEYIRYCELAMKKGSEYAKTELGEYFNDLGIDTYNKYNYSQARKYFGRAIQYGHVTARKNLDFMNQNNK
jgi:TPR repeat protein